MRFNNVEEECIKPPEEEKLRLGEELRKEKEWAIQFKESCREGNLKIVRDLCRPSEYGSLKRTRGFVKAIQDGFEEACKCGHINIVKFLTTDPELRQEGEIIIDIHGNEEGGLNVACEEGKIEVVRFLTTDPELIRAGHTFANIHAYNEAAFRAACKHNRLEVVRFLTTSKELKEAGHTFVNIHENWEEGLGWACANGHLEIVKFLTTSKELKKAGHTFVDIHEASQRGFRGACKNGNLEVVKFLSTSKELIEAGHALINIHENGEEAVRLAYAGGHWEVVEFLEGSGELIEAGHEGARLNLWQLTSLFREFCTKDHLEGIKFLMNGLEKRVERGDLSIKDAQSVQEVGFKAACFTGAEKVMEWLVLDYGIKKRASMDSWLVENRKALELFRVKEEHRGLKDALGEKCGMSEQEQENKNKILRI